MSFLPTIDAHYEQMPNMEITKEEYERRTKSIGKIDFSKLSHYESSDNTIGAKEFACVGGVCEI